MAIAQALGLFQLQAENRFDQGQVVEIAAGGPAHLGFVDPFAQVPPFAVFEEGRHPRHVEAHAPLARFPSCLGRLSQQLLEAGGQARQLGFRAQGEAPGVGGIQHVVAKGGGELGQLLGGGIEGQLLLTAQAHTPELHVPQLGLENALLGGIEPGAPLIQGLKGPIEAAALAGPVAKGHHVGLLLLVGGAQFRGVADPIEMAHHSPAPAQPLAQVLQGIHHLGPVQR